MAPFDQDPKATDTPPVRDSGVSGIFGPTDAAFRQPGDNASTQPGEFTSLFGKAPKPEPLEGIGTANPANGSAPEKQASADLPIEPSAPNTNAPGSFTMIFGASHLAAKVEPPPPLGPGYEPTQIANSIPVERPAIGSNPLAPPKSETGPFGTAPMDPSGIVKCHLPVPEKPATAATVPTAMPAAVEPPRGTSEFTMMFGNPARPAAASGVPEAFPEPTTPAPAPTAPAATFANEQPMGGQGAFTQLFGTPVKPGGQTPFQSAATANAQPATKAASPEEFASIFNFPLRDSSAKPEPAPKPAPGEFTSMFNATPAPAFAASPAFTPTAKDPGAFTKLFNAPATAASEAPKAQQAADFNKLFSAAPAEPKRESFTSVFGTGGAATDNSAKPAPFPPLSQDYPSSGMGQAPSPVAKQPMAGWPVATPSQTPASASSSGATQIFTRPGDAPGSPAPPPPPAGPSAFTQIVSGNMVREAQQSAAQAAQPQPPAAPSFMPPAGFPPSPMPPGVPPMPPAASPMPPVGAPMPNFAPPHLMGAPGMWPQPTPMPHMQMQMPSMMNPQMQMQMQMPQPPMAKPPALPTAPSKTNWVPLIIGVNVFVVIVLILILIFALRK